MGHDSAMYKPPWPDDEAVAAFIDLRPPPPSPPYWVSCLSAIVRDARVASHRDMNTGAVAGSASDTEWLGALAYMVMLDQVGDCFRVSGSLRSKPTLVAALRNFADLSDGDALALYALRCSFAHDYALVNTHRDPRLQHAFRLSATGARPVVKRPAAPWNGDLGRVRGNETLVDLVAFGDLAEAVVRRLAEVHEAGQLRVALQGGVPELFARYAFHVG